MEKYKQIYEKLYAEISAGKRKNGKLIPKEEELCRIYSASRVTVRHALALLESKGMIKRIRHVGTIVIAEKKTSTAVAVVFSHFENCEERVKNGLNELAAKLNVSLEIYDSESSVKKEREILGRLSGENVKALIIMPVDRVANIDLVSKIKIEGAVVVFMDFAMTGISAPLVTADGFGGVETATLRLIEKGHDKIAFYPFDDKSLLPTCEERFCGYCSALIRSGITINERYLLRGKADLRNYDVKIARRAVKAWEALVPRPTAVVCVNDVSAAAFIAAAEEKGYKVPQDVSVCGFDNLSRSIRRGVTTVWQDFGTIAREALRYALSDEKNPPPSVTKIKTVLVERSTTDTPKK